jgi:eukaryotic translation initiation factor 2C
MIDAFDSFSFKDTKYSPNYLFIVVCKHIIQRFFEQNSQGHIGNVPFGTVIDTQITSPIYDDFFLQSHKFV